MEERQEGEEQRLRCFETQSERVQKQNACSLSLIASPARKKVGLAHVTRLASHKALTLSVLPYVPSRCYF